jgi:calcium permeable stress-gated cation channel
MIGVTALFQIWIERRRFHPASYIFLDTGAHLLKTGSAEGLNPAIGSADAPPAAAPARVETAEQDLAGPQYGNTTGLHAAAFDPPSTWKEQPVVWIADDALGLGRSEVERLGARGVAASVDAARMDEKGGVQAERGPPDEAWYGGMTAA